MRDMDLFQAALGIKEPWYLDAFALSNIQLQNTSVAIFSQLCENYSFDTMTIVIL